MRITRLVLALAAAVVVTGPARSAEINVMISGGFSEAFKELIPDFEKQTGHKVVTKRGPSMGTTENAIPVRLSRGDPADVFIMVGSALDDLGKNGHALPQTKVDLANSVIGAVVKAGAPKPDFSSLESFKQALLNAKSMAYSDSASGVYVETEMFKKLGIEAQVKGKARRIPATPVAEIVARGEAEIGFQQVSELMAIKGVDFIGTIPKEVQKVTVFSAAIAAKAREPEAGKALIAYLNSPAVAPVIAHTGLDPLPAKK